MSTADNVRILARRRGMTFTKHHGEDRATLRDAAGQTLIVGTLSEVEAWIHAYTGRLRPGPRPKTAVACGAWQPMIDDYLVTLAAAGQSPLSIELRRGQLIVLAREIGCDPADVTAERLVAWFGDPSHNWSTEHRRSYRGAASRFFAWAYKTKRLPDYLGDELPGIDP